MQDWAVRPIGNDRNGWKADIAKSHVRRQSVRMSYRTERSLGKPTYGEIYSAATRLEKLLFWLSLFNFVAFLGVAQALGGDAINGMSKDGRYYLMSHGQYTEVSRAIFTYSTLHTLSLFVTFPIGMLAAFAARNRAGQRPL